MVVQLFYTEKVVGSIPTLDTKHSALYKYTKYMEIEYVRI
jgi:hypothetical protein